MPSGRTAADHSCDLDAVGRAAAKLAGRESPVSLNNLAALTGIGRDVCGRLRAELIAAGRWPWPIPGFPSPCGGVPVVDAADCGGPVEGDAPGEAEIAAACLAIRSGWSDDERAERSARGAWTVKEAKVPKDWRIDR